MVDFLLLFTIKYSRDVILFLIKGEYNLVFLANKINKE